MGLALIDRPCAHYVPRDRICDRADDIPDRYRPRELRLRGCRLWLRSRIALPQQLFCMWSSRARSIAPSAADRFELPILRPRTICGRRHKPIRANAASGTRAWDFSRQSSVQSCSSH